MSCGNTSQLINVKSFRKTPCVTLPLSSVGSTLTIEYNAHRRSRRPYVCDYFFLFLTRLIHLFTYSGLLLLLHNRLLINILIAATYPYHVAEEDHHDGQLRDLQGSLFGVFVARDR